MCLACCGPQGPDRVNVRPLIISGKSPVAANRQMLDGILNRSLCHCWLAGFSLIANSLLRAKAGNMRREKGRRGSYIDDYGGPLVDWPGEHSSQGREARVGGRQGREGYQVRTTAAQHALARNAERSMTPQGPLTRPSQTGRPCSPSQHATGSRSRSPAPAGPGSAAGVAQKRRRQRRHQHQHQQTQTRRQTMVTTTTGSSGCPHAWLRSCGRWVGCCRMLGLAVCQLCFANLE